MHVFLAVYVLIKRTSKLVNPSSDSIIPSELGHYCQSDMMSADTLAPSCVTRASPTMRQAKYI